MALKTGTRLGVYEVIDTLGVGGMGEVYRARDTRLQREVALKILPEAFAADPDRLARFEREAQVLASLNHPHIAALYGVEESSGTRALVLELVGGVSLADRIVAGPLPLHEALAIAKQIAQALEAAHEQGIIHRDLKPANIKVTADGTVKVLDFGLAKIVEAGGAGGASGAGAGISPTLSPTITTPAMTMAGVILGTAAYMSPEQAKGREADKRGDVWAFGCVLYEMLTGTRAFEAEDVSETLAAVLMRDPDWSRLPADLPIAIRTLLSRCLERDRRRRLGDIAGALLAMDESLVTGRVGNDDDRKRAPVVRPRGTVFATAGALVGALIAGGAVWFAMRPAPDRNVIRFQVEPPAKIGSPALPSFSISPDGQRLAFVTGLVISERMLWIRLLGSTAAQPVPGTEGVSTLLWSPESDSIVFSSSAGGSSTGDGRLQRVDLPGGPPVTLAEFGVPGAWSREGGILYRGRDGRVYQIAEGGGEARPVTALDKTRREAAHHPAFFLPDGRRFVYQAQSADVSQSAVYLSSPDDPSPVKLLDGLAGPLYANRRLFFHRDGTLMVRAFDPDSGRLGESATPIMEDVGHHPQTGKGAYSLSDNGVLVFQKAANTVGGMLTWLDPTGRAMGSVGVEGEYAAFSRPSLSPDGKRLAVTKREARANSDVYLIDLDRDVPTRFTNDEADDDSPLFTPDGSRLVFRSNRKGQGDLYVRGSGGVGVDEILDESEGVKRPTGFSPDGSILLFSRSPAGRPAETWALPLKEPTKPIALVKTGFSAGHAVFSPNGRWFAYCEGDSMSMGDQVYVQPFPPNGTRIRLSPHSGSSPQWSADGKTVYFTRTDNYVIAVDVTTERGELKAGVARELFLAPGTFEHRSVLADSARRRFLVPVPREQVTAAIDVIVNWPALLTR